MLDSQYPIGVWPQRFPKAPAADLHGLPDYTSYATFNDDVAAENMDFLLMCYQAFGDERLIDPIIRGMNAFIVTQMGQPQPGWGLQHTLDLLPAAARSYEPKALTTHTTATNLQLLVRFYRLTGETKFLARIPEARLEGEVEVDEVYVVAGHKGQPAAVAKRGARGGDAGWLARRVGARSRRISHPSSA